jgi:predicted transposase/invertase (TIGR01784 family)
VVNVELQGKRSGVFINRMVFYSCKLMVEELQSGEDYAAVRPVYCVAICNFIMLPEEPDYINHTCQCVKKSGKQLTDLINMVIVELPKMPANNDGSRAWPVLQCFRCKTIEEAEMHATTYPEVKGIVAGLRRFSLVKEIRSAYDLYQKAKRDRRMWENEYHSRGLEEGAAREREKWEAVVAEKDAALQSEKEALRREMERLRRLTGEAPDRSSGLC